MYTHVVHAGDCLSSIARQHGFGDWRVIYDAPDNAELRKERPNPSILLPGDRVVIPDLESKQVSCATGKMHRFQRRTPKTTLRLVLKDAFDEALAGKQYEIAVDGAVVAGKTDDNGKITLAIPAAAARGDLTVWLADDDAEPCRWTLELGGLDPPDTPTGVQSRLNNLGFNCGAVDGELGPRTRAALRAFQLEHDLPADGEPGPKTQAKLKDVHGS